MKNNKEDFTIELVKIINILYEINNFTSYNIDRLMDSFNINLYQSRKVIFDYLLKKEQEFNNICILGSWYGVWMVLMLNKLYPNCKITCVDFEPGLKEIAKEFYCKLNYDVTFKEVDVLDYLKCSNMKKHDLVINYSTEHMDDMKNHLIYDHCCYIFQSNNNTKCSEHTNCKFSINEFIQSSGLNKIYFQNVLKSKKMDRYTIVGRI